MNTSPWTLEEIPSAWPFPDVCHCCGDVVKANATDCTYCGARVSPSPDRIILSLPDIAKILPELKQESDFLLELLKKALSADLPTELETRFKECLGRPVCESAGITWAFKTVIAPLLSISLPGDYGKMLTSHLQRWRAMTRALDDLTDQIERLERRCYRSGPVRRERQEILLADLKAWLSDNYRECLEMDGRVTLLCEALASVSFRHNKHDFRHEPIASELTEWRQQSSKLGMEALTRLHKLHHTLREERALSLWNPRTYWLRRKRKALVRDFGDTEACYLALQDRSIHFLLNACLSQKPKCLRDIQQIDSRDASRHIRPETDLDPQSGRHWGENLISSAWASAWGSPADLAEAKPEALSRRMHALEELQRLASEMPPVLSGILREFDDQRRQIPDPLNETGPHVTYDVHLRGRLCDKLNNPDYFAPHQSRKSLTSEFQLFSFPLGAPPPEPPPRSPFDPKAVAEDIVDCSVYAPPAARLGETLMVQLFAHLSAQAAQIEALARRYDADTGARANRSLTTAVPQGARLAFELLAPGLEIDPVVQEILWTGAPAAVQFSVIVPPSLACQSIIATVHVTMNTAPIGHIKFKIGIAKPDSAPESSAPAKAGTLCRYKRAFISYASKDRDRVLARVQMLKTLGIGFFQDVLDLDPGERWEAKLYEHIDQADLFLLFWSEEARRSEWVGKEVRYAIGRKRGDESAPPEIKPVIIEGPPIPDPPEDLRHLHFSDPLRYFMSDTNS